MTFDRTYFKTWVVGLIGADGALGDLAWDVKYDKDFPESNDPLVLLDYLRSKGAHRDCLKAFHRAFKSFRSARKHVGEDTFDVEFQEYLAEWERLKL